MTTHIGTFGGIRIGTWSGCEQVVEQQVRFPRSKRRRIQKKWRKDKRNWETKKESYMYVLNGKALVSPEAMAMLQAAIPEHPCSFAAATKVQLV